MKFDRLSLEEGNNLYDMEYPVVIIKDRDISRELKGFLGKRFGIEKIFGMILKQFGFTRDDMIVLKSINYNEGMNVISFEYSVNLVNDLNNKIKLNYNCCRELVISDKDMIVSCECSITSLNDISIRIKKLVEKLDGNTKYVRIYGYSDSKYIINNGDKEIKLYLKKFNDNDYKRLMIIDDDKKIEDYFKNIDYNVSIDSLYKDIALYLGDIDSYNEIRLEISKIGNIKKEITDLLILENGLCREFMITRNNDGKSSRKVYLCSDESFRYQYDDELVNVSTICNNDKITYSVSSNNVNSLREGTFIYGGFVGFENSIDYVDDTKKLVREMFPKNNR